MENGGRSEGDRGTPWEDLLWEGSPQDVREGIPEDLRYGPGRRQDGAAGEDEPSNGAAREDEARDKTGAEFVAREEDGIPVRGDDNGLPDPGGREVLILLSESMPPLLLEAVFREHCGDPSVSLVFRGIPEDEADMGILPFLGRLQQAARQICPRGIRILLDHRPFSRFQAAMVPIMAWRLRDGAGGGPQEDGELLGAGDRRHGERDHKVEAPGDGSGSSWRILRGAWGARMAAPATDPDLPPPGELYPVTEIPLPELFHRRLARLPWDDLRRDARLRIRDRLWGHPLEQAAGRSVRRPDLTWIPDQDIRDHRGRLLIPRGQALDPLALRAFDRELLVIDLHVREQLEYAEQIVSCLPPGLPASMAGSGSPGSSGAVSGSGGDTGAESGFAGSCPAAANRPEDVTRPAAGIAFPASRGMIRRILMVSHLKGEEDWRLFHELTRRFGPVYLLTPEVARRFGIRRTPSRIIPDPRGGILLEEGLP